MAHDFKDIIISFTITFLHDNKIICNTYHYEGHIGASKGISDLYNIKMYRAVLMHTLTKQL